MIVAQMHLDGFGHFRDHRIDLDPGLTLIHGPNEAGKSTLRAFLTWVLFGTRRGQGGEGARWQPQSGGIAGSLLLVDGDRRYRIQRVGSTIRVHGPGLPSSGDEALGALLPRADRGLFETVFSVDGFDLAEAGSLGGQRVQEVLMAGAFTGTAAPRDAIATLADAAKALWGPRSGQIRELNHELTERRRSMREAQRAVLAYADKAEELGALKVRISELDQSRLRAEARAARCQRLLAALEPHAEARRLESELDPLREEPLLDEGVLASLQAAIGAEQSAHSAEAEARRALAAAEHDVAEAVVDEAGLACASKIEALAGDLGKLKERLDELPELAARHREAERQLGAALASLGKGWTVEALDTVDLSATRVAEADELAGALASLLTGTPDEERRAAEELQDVLDRQRLVRDALEGVSVSANVAELLPRIDLVLETDADVQRDSRRRPELVAEVESLSRDLATPDENVPALEEALIEEVDAWRRRLEEAEGTLRARTQTEQDRVLSARQAVSRSRAEVEAIARDPVAEGLATQVEGLADALRALPTLWEQARASRREAATMRQQLGVKLAALGAAPEGSLANVDVTHAATHRLQAAVDAQRDADQERQRAEAAVNEARRRLRESPCPDAPPGEQVEARRQAFARLRAAFEDVVAAEMRVPRKDRGPAVAWAAVVALLGIAVLAAASGAWTVSAAAGGFAVLAALATVTWLRPAKRVAPDVGPALRELESAARALGLEARPTRADIERIGAAIEKEEREATIAAEQRRAHESAKQAAAEAESSLALVGERLIEAKDIVQRIMREARLPSSVPPNLGPQWLAAARDAASIQVNVVAHEKDAQDSEDEAARLTQRLRNFCQPLGIVTEVPDVALAELGARAAKAVARHREWEGARAKLLAAEQALADAHAAHERAVAASIPVELAAGWASFAAACGLPGKRPDAALVSRLRSAVEHRRRFQTLAQARSRIDEIDARRRRHEATAVALASEAGTPEASPVAAIAALRRLSRQAADAAARRPDLEAAVRAAAVGVAKAERAVNDAAGSRHALETGMQRFEAWREALRAPADLPVSGARAWVDALRSATRAAESARSASSPVELARKELARARVSINDVASSLSEAPIGDDAEGIARIAAWKRRLDAATTARTALKERQAARSRSAKAHGDARSSLLAAQTTLGGKLEAVGVSDADALAGRVGRQRRRQDLEHRRAALEATLGGMLGGLGADPEIKAALGGGDPSRWEVEQAEAQAEAEQLRDAHRTGLQELGRLADELKRLAADTRVLELSTEVAEREEELARLHEAWARERTAAWLLEKTFEKYRRERQPAVLLSAGAWLKAATDGAYVEVEVEHESDGLAVRLVTRDAARLDAESLSAGTRGLLYLCLRLALADVFAKNSAPLPIVLDDVLVYLDPERAVGATRMLAEVATRHQILLMTCRPETVALVKGTIPACREVTLPRWAGSEGPSVVVGRTARHAMPDEAHAVDVASKPYATGVTEELMVHAERAIAAAGERGMSKDELRLALDQDRDTWEATWSALRLALLATQRVRQEGDRRGARYFGRLGA